jgi:hypothetical protein
MSNYHKWGDPTHLWGDAGRLWGDPIDPATDPILYWMIEIDWTNSGIYTGDNEAQYCIDMETNAGRTSRFNIDGNGNADGIKMPDVGTARIVLDNTTKRFDPYNAAGALYGNILPGRFIRIRCKYQDVIYPIFHGNIKSISTQNGENPTVTLDCEDGLRFIQQADTSVGLSTDVVMLNAVYQILQDIGWPSRFGYGTLLTGLVTDSTPFLKTIPFFSADGAAKERILELCNADRRNFWVNPDGTAQLWLWNTVQYNSGTFLLQESNTKKIINVPMPWENIITAQRRYYYPRARQATGTIWQSADNASPIAAAASITIWAEYTYNNEPCPALGVIAPVSGTDYTMFANSDGTGTDLTASFTVVQTDYGNKSMLVITNNSGSTGYITLLKIRGDAVANTASSYVKADSTAEIAIYGRKTLTLNSPYVQTYKLAANTTGVNTLNNDETQLEVQIEARPDYQLNLTSFIMNGANCYFPSFGVGTSPIIYQTMRIGHIHHKWLVSNGQAMLTTLLLEAIR